MGGGCNKSLYTGHCQHNVETIQPVQMCTPKSQSLRYSVGRINYCFVSWVKFKFDFEKAISWSSHSPLWNHAHRLPQQSWPLTRSIHNKTFTCLGIYLTQICSLRHVKANNYWFWNYPHNGDLEEVENMLLFSTTFQLSINIFHML